MKKGLDELCRKTARDPSCEVPNAEYGNLSSSLELTGATERLGNSGTLDLIGGFFESVLVFSKILGWKKIALYPDPRWLKRALYYMEHTNARLVDLIFFFYHNID